MNKMNKKRLLTSALKFIALPGFLFWAATSVLGQSSLDAAIDKYQISFPIAELGNCENFSRCHEYCEDPVNRTACVAYARKKGFYKEAEIESKKDQILAAAQAELGCDLISSCKAFCENESNFEKCTEFAKRHGLGGGQILSPKNQEILAKAKSVLGCDSPQSCKALCEKPENHQKCSDFAHQVGLQGGEEFRGPGGCNTPETCRAYCSEPGHREECSKFGPGPDGKEGPPCSSEEECRVYCQDHPDECRQFGYEPPEERPRGADETDEFCAKYPERCLDKGPDYENDDDFCRDHPEACPGPGSLDPETKEGRDFCQEHPEDCQEIQRGEGEREWESAGYNNEGFRYNDGGFQESFQEGFQGKEPEGFGGMQAEPPPMEAPEPLVKGISTARSIWQIILDFFFSR